MVRPTTPTLPIHPPLNTPMVSTNWINNRENGAESAVPRQVRKSFTTLYPCNRPAKLADKCARTASNVPTLALIRQHAEDKIRPYLVLVISASLPVANLAR